MGTAVDDTGVFEDKDIVKVGSINSHRQKG